MTRQLLLLFCLGAIVYGLGDNRRSDQIIDVLNRIGENVPVDEAGDKRAKRSDPELKSAAKDVSLRNVCMVKWRKCGNPNCFVGIETSSVFKDGIEIAVVPNNCVLHLKYNGGRQRDVQLEPEFYDKKNEQSMRETRETTVTCACED